MRITIDDTFWAPRQKTNAEVTLPAIYQRCEETGRIAAWNLNWQPGLSHEPHIFWDSDVAKWIEAAAYSLETQPNPALERQVDALVDRIAAAQQPDGYLNTYFTVVQPEMRWKNLRDWHELYCAGHLIEAGIAYFQAMGKHKLLQTVQRYADYIDSEFGDKPGQKRGYPGHEEIELALVMMYRLTGEKRYLKLAQFFVTERGRQPHYFDLEARARGEDPTDYWAKTHAYTQSHLQVREQTEPVGHAVRGLYLYCAMADLAAETGDAELLAACRRIWAHLTERRLYITGGVGSSAANEGYTEDYDLPNESAYAETCAAIGLVFWAQRMLQLDPDRRYADVMERALYNGVLSGVSLQGDTFFYENPLAGRGDHHRWRWHKCSCCPPNLARLLASLGRYIYSQAEAALYVHLYVAGTAELEISGQTVRLRQETAYPWDGAVRFLVELKSAVDFTLALRIPGWCRDSRLELNGEPVSLPEVMCKGYALLKRTWQPGDRLQLDLAMPVECLQAHPAVRENTGRVALQRGPVVYCLEEVDNGSHLHDLAILPDAGFDAQFEPQLLGGVVSISGKALRRDLRDWQGKLYRSEPPTLRAAPFKAVPYCAWDNRDPGEMAVWVRQLAVNSCQ